MKGIGLPGFVNSKKNKCDMFIIDMLIKDKLCYSSSSNELIEKCLMKNNVTGKKSVQNLINTIDL